MSHTWRNSPELKSIGVTTTTRSEPVQRSPTKTRTVKEVRDEHGNVIREEVVETSSIQGDVLTGNVPNKPQGAVEGKVMTDTEAIQHEREKRLNQDLHQGK